MSENAVLHGMVKEDLADKVTFRTRFTKEREPILRIYKKECSRQRQQQVQGSQVIAFLTCIYNKQQEGQVRFE